MGLQNGSSRENGGVAKITETSSLLPVDNSGLPPQSSGLKTFFNLVITVVGAGVLGLPYAFKQSGWLQGLLILAGTSAAMYYCMMLLVWSRRHLERNGNVDSITTFSELGLHSFGHVGQILVDTMMLLSQGGFCIAYLIFIGENLASVFYKHESITLTSQSGPESYLGVFSTAGSNGTLINVQALNFLGVDWRTKEVYVWIVFPLQVCYLSAEYLTQTVDLIRLSFNSLELFIGSWSPMIPFAYNINHFFPLVVHP